MQKNIPIDILYEKQEVLPEVWVATKSGVRHVKPGVLYPTLNPDVEKKVLFIVRQKEDGLLMIAVEGFLSTTCLVEGKDYFYKKTDAQKATLKKASHYHEFLKEKWNTNNEERIKIEREMSKTSTLYKKLRRECGHVPV